MSNCLTEFTEDEIRERISEDLNQKYTRFLMINNVMKNPGV